MSTYHVENQYTGSTEMIIDTSLMCVPNLAMCNIGVGLVTVVVIIVSNVYVTNASITFTAM